MIRFFYGYACLSGRNDPHKLTCRGLVDQIGSQIFRESRNDSIPDEIPKRNPFYRWIDDEIHYVLQKKGLVWDTKRNEFEIIGRELSQDTRYEIAQMYRQAHRDVIHAVVRRAFEFFYRPRKGCANRRPNPDMSALRTSLVDYFSDK